MSAQPLQASTARIVSPLSYATFIVPITGLIIALLLQNLVALTYVHVITGGTWTGIDLFMGLVMTRVMRGLSSEARTEVLRRLVPIMLFFMPVLASVAITSGIYLAQLYGLLNLQYPGILAAVIIVLILSVQGFGILTPNEVRIYLELRKEAPNRGKVVRLGMINFRVAGSQAIFQIAIIFVMANLRFGIVSP